MEVSKKLTFTIVIFFFFCISYFFFFFFFFAAFSGMTQFSGNLLENGVFSAF